MTRQNTSQRCQIVLTQLQAVTWLVTLKHETKRGEKEVQDFQANA